MILSDYLPNKKAKLLNYIISNGPLFVHDIIKWGCDNHYNHADRVKNKLIEEGLVKRIPVLDVLPNYIGKERFLYTSQP